MENIHIAGTDNAPTVDFDFQANVFSLSGMAFMEDASGFFGPLTKALDSHLESLASATVRFDFALGYFNSSAARSVLAIFDMLDDAAEQGNAVAITWRHEDDEDLAEQGEEFGEDLEHAQFEIINTEE